MANALPAARELPRAVLFACTLNSVRSPMAAAMLKHLTKGRMYVVSAGVKAGEHDPFVDIVMSEIGIDATRHNPQTIADLHDASFDLIITLSPEAHHHALELTRVLAVTVKYWPTPDPSQLLYTGNREQILAGYRDVRDRLYRRIKSRFMSTEPDKV